MKKLVIALTLLGTGMVFGAVAADILAVGYNPRSRGWAPEERTFSEPQQGEGFASHEPGPVVAPGDYRFTGPHTHENLTIYLIHGNESIQTGFLTLQEALERELAVVHETGQVSQLAIENRSTTEDLFIQSGDIVKGGKQDRVLQYDMVIPPGSGKVPLASFCVERGRWSPRGKENGRKFTASSSQLATRDLKLATRYKKSQGEVWTRVSEAQDRLGSSVGRAQSAESETSLQLTLETPNVQAAADRYQRALSSIVAEQSDVIGYAFAVNDRMNSAEVYGSSALFRKLWPKLLKASAVEAVAELKKGRKPARVKEQTVRAFLADAESGVSSALTIGREVQVIMQETDRSLLFETREGKPSEAWVHRTYLTK